MKLTDSEKLLLAMVCEIHTALKLNNNGYDSKVIGDALYTGNTWAINWLCGDSLGFEDRTDPPVLSDVVNILDMWEFLEEGFEALTPDEKKELEEKAEPFGRNVKFTGFDGNNENTHMSVANFLISKMNRFSRFSGRDLNSHTSSLSGYLRMYSVFEQWRDNYPSRDLNVNELAEILNARRHG